MLPELKKLTFTPYSINEIKPTGWLKKQLRIQADGLSGNLDLFWNDIKDSKWIGGNTDGWERMPYWLDGFLPLAWLLDDEELKSRATNYINKIIEKQEDDGWLLPIETWSRPHYDVWPLFLILKVLITYHDATGDERIVVTVKKALCQLDRHIDNNTLFNWSQTRWFECLIALWWIYEKQPEDWMLRLAVKLKTQGYDWSSLYKNWIYEKSEGPGRWSMMSHVVNNAMMLKAEALLQRYPDIVSDGVCAEKMVELLDKYHGMVTGVFTGDECLAGNSPIQGTELCSVVEYMYSLEHLISITGNPLWSDRLEKIAYNALPATFSPDMWTHQYNQQVNQVQCCQMEFAPFYTNGGHANLFGLEPNFGCCTANLSQGWPKFAASVFMKSEDGIAVTAYAPSELITKIAGKNVSLKAITDYPFRYDIKFTLTCEDANEFAVYLRVPSFAESVTINIEGEEIQERGSKYIRIFRKWSGTTEFTLRINVTPELVERPNNLYAVMRAPLVYSLDIPADWKRIFADMPGHEFPHCDYELYPKADWNYGLNLDKHDFLNSLNFEECSVGDMPFSPEGAPVICKTKGKKIDWKLKNGYAEPVPSMEWVSDEAEEIKLIPYGCTNLRLTEMPLIK